VLEKLERVISLPAELGILIAAKGGEWAGSNYLCHAADMRAALLIKGFELISVTKN
jgi:hypothetical protein